MKYVLIFRFFIFLGLYYPIYILLKNKITKPEITNISAKVRCLMLSPEKFRGDFYELSKRSDMAIYRFSLLWLSRLYLTFYNKVNSKKYNKTRSLLISDTDKSITKNQKKYHTFLKYFLTKIFKEYKIDCILSADVRYIVDIDLGLVSEKLNTPYIVLHRENLFASKKIYNKVKKRHSEYGVFKGSKLIVHNQVSKKLFLDSGFISNSNKKLVEIGGCLRMDSFFKSMNQKSRAKSNCITFFPFLPKTTSPWPKKLLHLVNQEIAKFALKNPDVDIFIKPKSRDLDKSNWKNIFDESLQEIAVNQKEINNLKISSKFNTYDLLKKSKYIIALNSSVILEAAILGKPVIIPYFDIIKNNKYKDSIYFRESLKCFDTPKDSEQLRKFLTKRLKNSFINKRILTQRKNLFKKYFHYYGRNISDNYFRIIQTTIKEKDD